MIAKVMSTAVLATVVAAGANAQEVEVPVETRPEVTEPLDPLDSQTLEEGWQRVETASISSEDLIGQAIVNLDGEEIAQIEDMLVTETGEVQGVVAKFGGFLGFGTDRVLLTMNEIDVVRDTGDNLIVRSTLTPEALQGRPPHEG